MKLSIALLMLTMSVNANSQPLKSFHVDKVRITGGDMLERQMWDEHYILSLDADRLLYYFRELAGLKNPADKTPYSGWEATDLKGHTLGHWLTALSLMAGGQYSNEENRVRAQEKLSYTIDVLEECQEKTGSGYLSAFSERKLDIADKTGQGWAPYYTLHKILQGLLDAYEFTGNSTALDVASRFGDYIYDRTTRIDSTEWQKVLDIMEVGGFAESMLNLYNVTKKSEHYDAGHFFQQYDKLKPASQGLDILHERVTDNFNHANGTIPQFIASKREYDLTGNKEMLNAATNFWEFVVNHRTYSNGTTGYHEHWNLPSDNLSKEMDLQAGETCCTYNMIKLSDELFTLFPNSKYADYVERAVVNDIMGSIEPETANFMYFHTQKPGGFKIFGPNEEVFWCCTATGMENHLRYSQNVYFRSTDNDTLYINQFFPTELKWTERNVKIMQQTDFPLEESSKIKITEGGGEFSIKIRIPFWCRNNMTVKVNGKKVKNSDNDDNYIKIRRKWMKGDEIAVSLPMTLYTEPLADNPKMASIKYGPIVLAADLGKDGVRKELINSLDYFYEDIPEPWQVKFNVPSLTGNPDKLNWIKRHGKTLEFQIKKTSDGSEQTLKPLYQIYDSRFVDYWTFD